MCGGFPLGHGGGDLGVVDALAEHWHGLRGHVSGLQFVASVENLGAQRQGSCPRRGSADGGGVHREAPVHGGGGRAASHPAEGE